MNNDGFLWYDEDTMTVYVSNWDDAQSPNGSCTWLSVDGTHLIREVLYVGEELQPLLNFDGSVLSGGGTTWQLGGARFPLNPGMKIIIEDNQTTIVSVVTKDVDGIEYREIVTSDSITLDDRVYETRFTVPSIGGHPYWEDLHNQSGGGSEVHVGEDPPAEEEGALWFDTTRLELYVYYVEGEDGGWVPTSPLGARVAAGEAKQLELEGRISQGEQRQNIITNTIGAIQEDYLSKETGGTIKDLTIVDRPSGTAFKIKKSGVDHVKIEAGGKIFCNYNMELDEDDSTVPNKGWIGNHYIGLDGNNSVEESWKIRSDNNTKTHMMVRDGQTFLYKVASPTADDQPVTRGYANEKYQLKSEGGSNGPTRKYDGNRFCVAGTASTRLNEGEVVFLTDQLASTAVPSQVTHIGLPIEEFDWTNECSQSGVIKVKSGAYQSHGISCST